MKKILFSTFAIALMMTSCAQEDVLSVNDGNSKDNLITFRVHAPKITRAQDYTTENLKAFNVFGYKGWPEEEYEAEKPLEDFFEEGEPVLFSYNDELGVFTSATPYYYPSNGSYLYFNAYAPINLSVEKCDDYGGVKIEGYTVKSNITEQEDIIFANGLGHLDYNEPDMELDFTHALSKVFVSDVANTGNPYKYEIKGLKFGNIAMTGDYEYRGVRALSDPGEQENGSFDEDGYLDDYDGYGHFWKASDNQTESVEVIFDKPIVLDAENTRASLMDAYDEDLALNKANASGSFMLIPQKLSKNFVNDDGEFNEGQEFNPEMSYIAFLVRITNTDKGWIEEDPSGNEVEEEFVVYPFNSGVEAISATYDDKTYAWAAFPISSLWVPGRFIDYFVDFSKGAGFVAPGAAKSVECQPILSKEIRFGEWVMNWQGSSKISKDHENEEQIDGNGEGLDDPFADFD